MNKNRSEPKKLGKYSKYVRLVCPSCGNSIEVIRGINEAWCGRNHIEAIAMVKTS